MTFSDALVRQFPFLRFILWWQWERTPARAPVRLTQNRIYVMPTLTGLAFAAVLVVMLVASINYGLGLGYAFVFLLASTAAASLIHAFRDLLHLMIRYGKAEPTFCGGSVVFHLLIDNPSSRRRAALHMIAGDDPDARGEAWFDLPPAACGEVAIALSTTRRGILPLGRTIIETRWPLGFIRAWSVFVPDMTALVFPAPAADPPPPPSGAGSAAASGASLQAGNEDFTGLRAWQITDSPRHLAWKVIARGGEMMTKQFSASEGGDLFLDWNALPPALSDEARLSVLCTWLLRAERAGQRYALRLPACEFSIGRGDVHLSRCLGALALFGLGRQQDTT
ncbi:MAG: DUF58 domain-containing protein [Azoarcus sp.]|jgi:uncharacterized protein (DUF58 family)|nr:DUF58 domain-containing protein [Azoarcus sp.]